jgi:hypothetical protein
MFDRRRMTTSRMESKAKPLLQFSWQCAYTGSARVGNRLHLHLHVTNTNKKFERIYIRLRIMQTDASILLQRKTSIFKLRHIHNIHGNKDFKL